MSNENKVSDKSDTRYEPEVNRQHKVRWLALLVLGLGTFVTVVDSSVVLQIISVNVRRAG